MAIDLKKLSQTQLNDLIVRAERRKEEIATEGVQKVRDRILKLLSDEGFTFEQVFGTKRGRGIGGSALGPMFLADALGDRAVAVPPLVSRPEDLRALAQAHLSRACARRGVDAFALEPSALAELLEAHAWSPLEASTLESALVTELPEIELDLAALMTRAALSSHGPLVTRADLAAIGFTPQAPRGRGTSRPPSRRHA